MSYQVDYGDYSEHDRKYEEFRSDTGHITDFGINEKPLYEKAIAEYGDKTLRVGDGYHKGQCALYLNRIGDLGAFWVIVRKLEAQNNM